MVVFKELLEEETDNGPGCGWMSPETTNRTYSQDTIIDKARTSIVCNVNFTFLVYSKAYLKRPLKNRQNKGLKDKW